MKAAAAFSTRDELKHRTTALHALAERFVWSDTGFRSFNTYLCFLGALRTAHHDLGIPAATRLGSAESLTQEHGLLRDLNEDLGSKTSAGNQTNRGAITDAYAWGVRYALGGSAIGAASLLRSGHLPDHWPKRYLRAQASAARNGQVKALFDAINAQPIAVDQATCGANAVFNIIVGSVRDARE